MKLTLVENFRAMFYTPFYATAELGAYKAEGLDVELVTPSAIGEANKMLAAGSADVSWGGPMRLMLARDKNPQSDMIGFCEVVGRDPFFLIGRTPNASFQLKDLLGKSVATVSEVPTPWVALQHDLRGAGIDPASVKRISNRTMGENVAALRAGEVDVIQVFHPFARTLVDEGIGHLWYTAASRGLACYTTLNTTREFMTKHPDVLLAITRATYRTQKWIAAHDGADLAKVVERYLPDIPQPVLAACCNEYKASEVWSRRPIVQRAGIEWKREAMLSSGMITKRYEYEDYIEARFAEQVVREDSPSI